MTRVLVAIFLVISLRWWPAPTSVLASPAESAFQLATNGAGLYRTWVTRITNATPNPRFGNTNFLSASNRLPPEVAQRLRDRWAKEPQFVTNVMTLTNAAFVGFVPESLNHLIWTNFVAHTNGRTTQIWSRRQHSLLWPATPPSVEWNTSSLIWGMKGMTALSPCWQQEGASGQVPVTLLTRRHGYTRGHGMGPEGFKDTFAGKKVWFVTAANEIVEARVTSAAVRAQTGRDYTILMFAKDLPSTIEPLRVVSESSMLTYYSWPPNSNPILLKTEQGGHVSTDLPGFMVSTFKGGDSGSPNLLPFLNELIFIGGRTTSGPSAKMQSDIDALCVREGVDPRNYQLQWVDLSAFPKF